MMTSNVLRKALEARASLACVHWLQGCEGLGVVRGEAEGQIWEQMR